ncbi:MAG: hypothetical protein COV59_02485 [Candidatus Magasanikbacteria bacterium CG11_big_fil_rev_8_21_14_0_20_39_34]|uniref:DUF1648 domain-containing protein n=1 Tax=Candidatus Magasanikbacteria bacterium CG11_big_fil_rev_8_21_14_0_20_39_34 TaxID=1974653 RepID=A0A2H0N545_9BACT|nr:MAG: hypothetical protein COV59_02485 [Candidatus Magasanikbacteria bacterium CG11_big_fil_rev_8_21_14_0_20_39_34]
MYPLKLYFKNSLNIVFLSLALLMNISLWVWLFLDIGPREEQIFLHYNILYGVDLIGTWGKVLYLPIIGLCILIINAFLGWLLFERSKVPAYLLSLSSVVCHIFLLLAAYLLVFLNV